MTIENLINIENLFASLDLIKMHLGTVAASIFLSNFFVIEDYQKANGIQKIFNPS